MGIDVHELAKRYPNRPLEWYAARWTAGKDPNQQRLQESFATPRKGSRTVASTLKVVPPEATRPWPSMSQLSLF